MSNAFAQTIGAFTDSRDGKTYKTIKIGNQIWMAENLNYVTEKGSWIIQGDSSGKLFGRFYDWEAAKEAIPAGWHLPSKQEFEILCASLGVAELPNSDKLYKLLVEGGIAEFNVKLTGSYNDSYGKKGQIASFWSSEESWLSRINPFMEFPWRLVLRAPNYVNIGKGAESDEGFNVRCIKD